MYYNVKGKRNASGKRLLFAGAMLCGGMILLLMLLGMKCSDGNETDTLLDPLSSGASSFPAQATQTPTTVTGPSRPENLPTETVTIPTQTEPAATDRDLGGKYLNVGSGYVAEVILYSAETFEGTTVDDYSLPTNNYLPAGTVDYCASELVSNGSYSYVQLRSGQRIYFKKKNIPMATKVQVVKQYQAQLPDHNEIGVVSYEDTGRHTVLTLDCLWKAPFYFDLAPQNYLKPTQSADRDYSVSAFTAKYVDITFCYATTFTGQVQIPADDPVFRAAEVIKNEHDHTLRLYFRKTGSFYGWDAYYNAKGQLCFRFLKPAQVVVANNACGADLTGVKIMIDVGHGGHDCGATALSGGKELEEADLNLNLAWMLTEKLEAAGATVIMNRTTDRTLTTDERLTLLKEEAPDLCIAIHQNSNEDSKKVSGFESYYYTPFSLLAATKICNTTRVSGIYKSTKLGWHVYFTARQTLCPVVLTENGYMSNTEDLKGMTTDSTLNAKANAIALGIGAYFLAIRN